MSEALGDHSGDGGGGDTIGASRRMIVECLSVIDELPQRHHHRLLEPRHWCCPARRPLGSGGAGQQRHASTAHRPLLAAF